MNTATQPIEGIPPPSIYIDEEVAVTRCAHRGLRTFTLKTGEMIQSCPTCTKFDKKRQDILAGGRLFDLRDLGVPC
jgi:hypothetical protein